MGDDHIFAFLAGSKNFIFSTKFCINSKNKTRTIACLVNGANVILSWVTSVNGIEIQSLLCFLDIGIKRNRISLNPIMENLHALKEPLFLYISRYNLNIKLNVAS